MELRSIEYTSNHSAKSNLKPGSAIDVPKAITSGSPKGIPRPTTRDRILTSSSDARTSRVARIGGSEKTRSPYWLPTGCHAAHREPPLPEADPLSSVRGIATDAWRRLARWRCGVAAPCPASSAPPPSKKPCSPACAVRALPADTRPEWRLVHRSWPASNAGCCENGGCEPPAETATTRAVERLPRLRPR